MKTRVLLKDNLYYPQISIKYYNNNYWRNIGIMSEYSFRADKVVKFKKLESAKEFLFVFKNSTIFDIEKPKVNQSKVVFEETFDKL